MKCSLRSGSRLLLETEQGRRKRSSWVRSGKQHHLAGITHHDPGCHKSPMISPFHRGRRNRNSVWTLMVLPFISITG